MGLKIYWTDFAKLELRKISEYYKKEANLGVAQKEHPQGRPQRFLKPLRSYFNYSLRPFVFFSP